MPYINDFFSLKAQFLSGESVLLRLELQNPRSQEVTLIVQIKIWNLTRLVEEKQLAVSIGGNESKSVDIEIPPQEADMKGFGAEACLFQGQNPVDAVSTAFDVVSNYKKAARYGFLSDFGPEDESADDVESLLKFHINLVQFYDWVYRHDDYLPPKTVYRDLMGKEHSFDVVQTKIRQCRRLGMKTLAYGAVYASGGEYCRRHPESALYTSSGNVYRFIDIFNIMNIEPDSPWHDHIIGEYEKAVKVAGFDGIHMDTYGFPKTGISKCGEKQKEVSLQELFPTLIRDTKERLKKSTPDCCLIFNNVCNWPTETVAKTDVDIVYIEVWEPYERYFHIQQIISRAKCFGDHKPVVLAAYLKPFQIKGKEEEAENAALLLTATIAANGGYHLLLGEKNAVLTQGYYPDYSVLRGSFVPRFRKYYDFIVRYSEILYDDTLLDVTMTHCGGDNREYAFESEKISLYPQADRVWIIIKENRNRKVIHFINLIGNGEDYWNRGKKEPAAQRDIPFSMEVLKAPRVIYTVSPDFDSCKPRMLAFNVHDSERGKIASSSLPQLSFWSTVVIEF